jgi:hypothetical protein
VINRHPIGYGVYHDTDGDECSYGMESGCGDYVDGDDYQKLVEAYDALLAERDALQQQVESLQNKWAQRPLSVADTAALEAENDALRADAERYRWIRRCVAVDDPRPAEIVSWDYTADELDAAIDACLQPVEGDEQP